ncbi:hypothetical protein HanRHA438_Chr08g0344861 [Helianthus annuus]|nr:hypothetical protein HanIR_Chr08g0360161 [Helianthus annuus]KAJ0897360.1 hypothetical protein HanRHA438_Chr08g0344861 [Helianthus annuus]
MINRTKRLTTSFTNHSTKKKKKSCSFFLSWLPTADHQTPTHHHFKFDLVIFTFTQG